MRINSITARDVLPVRRFEVSNLSDVVVLAGPNGVGKTRLIAAMLAAFQNPRQQTVKFVIEATSSSEKEKWQATSLDTSNLADAAKLSITLQQNRKRSRFESSVINFESDRSIQQIAPYNFSWDYQDPFEESVGWQMGYGGLRGRLQDTIHSMFRKVRSRRELIARTAERMMKEAATSGVIELNTADFPDPLEPFKLAFRQLLAPKELADPDLQRQSLEYIYDGNTFPIATLSSGEREVVNIVFDFLLRGPRDCIVFFDEPELHLHPELSYKLLQALKTVGANNQFLFSTHSPDIITASLDNSVVFIGPPRSAEDNQAIVVEADDNTHQALKLLGQSIGIISLGKKIVLIEGTDSSLDKQTYGSILRDRFPNLVLVPGGGKGILSSFETLGRNVLDRTLWGVEFFILCDRDAVPISQSEVELKKRSGSKVALLGRYHLENYFFEETVIAEVFKSMEPKDSPLLDPAAIRARLMEIARSHASYAVALAASFELRELVGNIDVMPKDCGGKGLAELCELIGAKAVRESARTADILKQDRIEATVTEYYKRLQDSFANDTDYWKQAIPGKAVLNIFAARARFPVGRLKTAYIRAAETAPTNPFDEVIQIFARFAATPATSQAPQNIEHSNQA
jgi:energy-coupling factor transporter ATP-binding protein EcfA2